LSDADTARISAVNGTPGPPVEVATIPHEFGHGLLHYVREASGLDPTLDTVGESGSLDEALADLYGIGSVHLQLGPLTDWFCIQDATTCLRDVSNPPRLSYPVFYKGQDYGIYTDVRTARTRTIASCTAILPDLALGVTCWPFGTAGSPAANPCDLTIEPLDPNPDVAMKMVLNILYLAAGTRLGLTGSTRQADVRGPARSIPVGHTRSDRCPEAAAGCAPASSELAWYAVGVLPSAPLERGYGSEHVRRDAPRRRHHDLSLADVQVAGERRRTDGNRLGISRSRMVLSDSNRGTRKRTSRAPSSKMA